MPITWLHNHPPGIHCQMCPLLPSACQFQTLLLHVKEEKLDHQRTATAQPAWAGRSLPASITWKEQPHAITQVSKALFQPLVNLHIMLCSQSRMPMDRDCCRQNIVYTALSRTAACQIDSFFFFFFTMQALTFHLSPNWTKTPGRSLFTSFYSIMRYKAYTQANRPLRQTKFGPLVACWPAATSDNIYPGPITSRRSSGLACAS